MDNYFQKQASTLLESIQKGLVTEEDIAAALQCLYSVGVIDANRYSEKEKATMYEAVKKIYSLRGTHHERH